MSVNPTLSRSEWEPILPDRLRSATTNAIYDLGIELWKRAEGVSEVKILSDVALALAYLSAREQPDSDEYGLWRKRAIRCAERAADLASAETSNPVLALYGGMCGLGWVLEHITSMFAEEVGAQCTQCVDSAEDDAAADIDQLVLARLQMGAWPGVYDLIGGLVGIGVYCLERLPRPGAVEGIRLVLKQLRHTAVRFEDKISWHSPPHLLPDHQLAISLNGFYNLGVAHGVPGIAYFLGECVSLNVESDKAEPLLEGLLRWILHHRRPEHNNQRFGPYLVPGTEQIDSRLGWCYGDLGIGGTLLHTSCRLQRPELQAAAIDLLERSLQRGPEDGFVFDAPLCHGALGISHVYNRAYQLSGDLRFREAAVLWLERTLEMRRHGTGVAGFSAWRSDVPGGMTPSPAFLDGASGVLLGLLAVSTTVTPEWDRLLGLSGRPNGVFNLQRDVQVQEITS